MKSFLIENIDLLQGKEAMESLFNTLKSTPEFTEFGDDKIIITWGIGTAISLLQGKFP